MCENPAVVCQLMPGVFQMDGAFRAEQQGALQPRHCVAGVDRASEVHERDRRCAARVAAGHHAQARVPRAAICIIITFVPALVPPVFLVYFAYYFVFYRFYYVFGTLLSHFAYVIIRV